MLGAWDDASKSETEQVHLLVRVGVRSTGCALGDRDLERERDRDRVVAGGG